MSRQQIYANGVPLTYRVDDAPVCIGDKLFVSVALGYDYYWQSGYEGILKIIDSRMVMELSMVGCACDTYIDFKIENQEYSYVVRALKESRYEPIDPAISQDSLHLFSEAEYDEEKITYALQAIAE